jgi:hypothetical protein
MLPSTPFAKGFDPLALIAAEESGFQADFNAITRTGTAKLVNPQAGYDTAFYPCPPPPADNSRATAAELLEVGAAVLFRDVPFAQIGPGAANMPLLRNCLRHFGADFKGPTRPDAMLRRSLADLAGPYVSQLLLLPVPAGNTPIEQRTRLRLGSYGITAADHAALQAGLVPQPQQYGADVLPHTPRALASMVHQDPPFLLALNAALILGARAQRSTLFPPRPSEAAFVSYGGPVDLQCAIAEVTRLALAASWDVKWRRYLRRRPEALWADQGSLHADFMAIGQAVINAVGPFLPLVYAEGCPIHPDYPSGHAAIGGATATVLKAWFADGEWAAVTGAQPVHSIDGQTLVPWLQPANPSPPPPLPVTVHGEINKFASNLGWGRNFAGIHLRSSADSGMALGEAVALRYLAQRKASGHESLGAVTFQRFDGSTVTI